MKCFVIAALGLWLNRLYIVGHEAVHRKLFPDNAMLNELIGTLILLPLIAPLTIYRKIHYFHHAHNRQSPGIATLDTFITSKPLTPLRGTYYQLVWFFCVFCGGFFLHTLVSILLFLLLPTRMGEQISPAFIGWKLSARLKAWGEFALGVGFHFAIYKLWGFQVWLTLLGLPLLVFAWLWSMLLYIYHYQTTIGDKVTCNVRSLKRHPFFSWLLLNFNEHVTHHANPQIPWYLLPEKRIELSEAFQSNQNVATLSEAIWQQLKGPTVMTSRFTENVTHTEASSQ
ncbi:MAG: fatty acid desaturase [Microcoleus sp. SIO2G3]|nr:fatty acid desaturase [Microcoleus sp. SIO2G3]